MKNAADRVINGLFAVFAVGSFALGVYFVIYTLTSLGAGWTAVFGALYAIVFVLGATADE